MGASNACACKPCACEPCGPGTETVLGSTQEQPVHVKVEGVPSTAPSEPVTSKAPRPRTSKTASPAKTCLVPEKVLVQPPEEPPAQEPVLPGKPGSWSFKNFDFSTEPALRLCTGTDDFDAGDGKGVRPQRGGRVPKEEMEDLLAKELTSNEDCIPPVTTEAHAAEMLRNILSGEAKLDPGHRKYPPELGMGVQGSTVLHLTSITASKALYELNNALFFCLEDKVGFSVVSEEGLGSLWFKVWRKRVGDAVNLGKDLLVLTGEDGSLGFRQTVEVLWLQREGIAFRHMRTKAFLLQVRPLVQSVWQGNYHAVEDCLLSAQTEPLLEQRMFNGYGTVHILARNNEAQLLGLALSAVAAGTELPAFGFQETPLTVATHWGHGAVVKTLLTARAAVDPVDSTGATALFRASRAGHEAVMRELLAARADVEKHRPKGSTPLTVASDQGHEAAVKLLLAARADAGRKGHSGRTPLQLARAKSHDSVASFLQGTDE